MNEWITKLSPNEMALYGLLITAIGGAVLALLNHMLSTRRERHKNLIPAAVAFRSTINSDIFRGIKGHQLHGALIQSYPMFKAAVHEYHIHLGWFDRLRLNLAWKQYCSGNEEYPELFKPYCIKDNGPETLKYRLEKLKSIGNKR